MEEVSIIVPIYNVEQYVEKCLNSLLKQTYNHIKIYAVSDGSPDHSFEIAQSVALKDKRVICINKENGGYGSVLQETISRIKSKYFMICDPDDWIAPNAVETLLNAAERNNLDIVIADKYNVSVDNDEPILVKTNSEYNFINITPNKVERSCVDRYSFLYVSPHAKLYRTDITKNIKFPKKVSHTDFILYLISLSNAKRVMYIDVPLAYYLQDRPGNTNTDRTLKSINSHIVVWGSTYDQLNGEHNYLFSRLYFEYKMILCAYCKNNLNNKDTFNRLKDVRGRLIKHKRAIRKINNNGFLRKMDYYLLLNRFFPLKWYIFINRAVNGW